MLIFKIWSVDPERFFCRSVVWTGSKLSLFRETTYFIEKKSKPTFRKMWSLVLGHFYLDENFNLRTIISHALNGINKNIFVIWLTMRQNIWKAFKCFRSDKNMWNFIIIGTDFSSFFKCVDSLCWRETIWHFHLQGRNAPFGSQFQMSQSMPAWLQGRNSKVKGNLLCYKTGYIWVICRTMDASWENSV